MLLQAMTVGAAALPGCALPAAVPAAGGQPLRARAGFIDDPSVYFDVIEPLTPTGKSPVLLVHGGAHTGACMLATADNRPGWAHVFASRGYPAIVPDWPGTGRSGYVASEQLTGELVLRGLAKILLQQEAPVVLVTHSMSGPFGWKLLERHGERIAALVAIAPGGPGNLVGPIEQLTDSAQSLEVRLAPGAPVLKLSKTEPFVAEAGWASKKLIGPSRQWPAERTPAYLASLRPIPPRLLLERVNYQGSAPKVVDFRKYRDKRVAVVTGTDDPDHPLVVDRAIAEWLVANGAKGQFLPLGEVGILGNGHMMMMERNSDQIAAGIVDWLETGKFSATA